MTVKITLKAREGSGTKSARATRREERVPGVIYGDNIASRSFTVGRVEAEKLIREVGTSSLFDATVEGEEKAVKAILHDWQSDPVSGALRHIDFYQVRMDKPLHAEVHLEFVGESPAVKNFSGVLVKQLHELPISCLPSDLIHNVDVDLSRLATFEDVIRVKDLQIPSAVTVGLDPEDIVAQVTEPRSEEELAEMETVSETEAIESVERVGEKKEGEEAEATEGEPAKAE